MKIGAAGVGVGVTVGEGVAVRVGVGFGVGVEVGVAVSAGVPVAVAVAVGVGVGVPAGKPKGIHFIVVGDIDASASDGAVVPLARAGHQLVGAAAGVNNRAGVTIVSMQAVVTLGTDNPYDHVVGPIRRCNPGRSLAALTDAPRRAYRRRSCRRDLIGLHLLLAQKTK